MSHGKQTTKLGLESSLSDSGHFNVGLVEVNMIAMMAFHTQTHETAGIAPKGSHMKNS